MANVRIGNGCGFWGDNLDAPIILAEKGDLHYLTLEYLAELTMSILAVQKQRRPEAGFARDFLDVLARLTPILRKQPQLKIITNAGGMNPRGCAEAARDILVQSGLADRKVALVAGDDLLPRLDTLIDQGHELTNLDTGEPLASVRSRVVSANAYLGAMPIADAVRRGASIVVTGRVADASLTVAPAMVELGWNADDWDRLAAATVAGHLIECGAQVTGGLYCRWKEVPDYGNIGYPIADIASDGSFTIEKPPGTGGVVNIETVSEQLLYEVGDPANYLTPDVTADFTSVKLSDLSQNRVRVGNARGKPATDSYKMSIAYRDGYTASGTLVLAGPNAIEKGQLCGNIIADRVKRAGITLSKINVECLGSGAVTPDVVRRSYTPPEVVLRVTAQDESREAIERFSKEFAPLVTSGPPGVTGYTTGRPPVREVFAYWPALVPKSLVQPKVTII